MVYARVSLAHAFTDPEIECVDPTTQRAEGYGEMTGGMLIRDIELSRCRACALSFSHRHQMLNRLSGFGDTAGSSPLLKRSSANSADATSSKSVSA